MKNYRHFGDFIDNLTRFNKRQAITTRTFIKFERLSYEELRLKVFQTSNYLSSLGIVSGQRIMVVGSNSPQWVELFLGAQLIGAIIVPVDAQSNIETVLNYTKKVSPVVTFRDRYTLVSLDSHIRTCLLEELDTHISGHPITPAANRLSGDEVALIVFTSGTTAAPKGVVLTQRNILANVAGIQQALTIDPAWRLLSVLPLSHMYELTGGCLAPLSGGASIFYLPRVTPLAIARGLQDYQITTILAVPQLLILFLQQIRQAAAAQGKTAAFNTALWFSTDLPFLIRRIIFHSVHKQLGGKLDMVVTGGAPIPIEVATVWEKMGVKMVQGYGLTETSPIISVNNPNRRRLDSQGQVLNNIRFRINKQDDEIQVKGPSIFTHYWDDDAATKAAFTEDGWFKTGDIGRLHNNWLQIRGRSKFVIVLSSGLKVFPEDVEMIAGKNPVLKDICIVGINHPDGDTVRAIIISEKSDSQITQAIADINSMLESFQHISDWKRWPESDFPRTRLLKIDHRLVQQWANTDVLDKTLAPENGTLIKADPLVHIIRLALDKPQAQINKNDRLADIGLDSLRRLTVTSLIEEQLNISISESSINNTTTLSDLRKLVAQGSPAVLPINPPLWTFRPWIRFLGNGCRETIVRSLLRIWVRQNTQGSEQLEKISGPALFIFNHIDDFDAPVLYKALPWRIRKRLAIAAADDVLHKHKVLALVTRFVYAGFNFSRNEPYMPSLEYVAKLIDRNWNIALAPEGKLSTDGKLHKFKSGIGLLAVELGIPVVPVKSFGLAGTVPLHSKWPKKHSKVTVRIGKPVRFDKQLSYDEATSQLYKIMKEL